jgi:RNA polymerase sigma-70 factor (ECF subfamily)
VDLASIIVEGVFATFPICASKDAGRISAKTWSFRSGRPSRRRNPVERGNLLRSNDLNREIMALPVSLPAQEQWSDEQVIARVLGGEVPVFELLMRRHNERIYRAVRSILRDEMEVEDVMQSAYLHAYAHLGEFQARAKFSTWLTRIAVHEALARRRKLARAQLPEEEGEPADLHASPEDEALDREHRILLRDAIDALPEHYRSVFVLRQVQELSVEETAQSLDLNEETVKTRLHRARGLLREAILEKLEDALGKALPFEAPRCDRVVAGVLSRIR